MYEIEQTTNYVILIIKSKGIAEFDLVKNYVDISH